MKESVALLDNFSVSDPAGFGLDHLLYPVCYCAIGLKSHRLTFLVLTSNITI